MPEDNVVPLKKIGSDPEPEVISLLEEKLQEAKDGEIRSIAMVCVTKGDVVGTLWERGDGGSHLHQLTAGAASLLHRLCASE